MMHYFCLQNLPGIVCLDRAVVVGDDGPTHHGVFDIPMLRAIPNLVFAQPADERELANLLFSALKWDRPVCIRYPRGAGSGALEPEEFEFIEPGRAVVARAGKAASIWALGDMLPVALAAADILAARGIETGVVNPRFIRPLDKALLTGQAADGRVIATLENGAIAGGFGSAVAEALAEDGLVVPVLRFGWPDRFVPQGTPTELMRDFGLTPEAVARALGNELAKRGP